MSEQTPTGNEHVGPGGKNKKGLLTGKNKWYVVGGLAVIAVLVFVFVRKSNANAAGSTSATGTTPSGLDPATASALQSALQAQAAQGATASGGAFQGAQGPAGPAGAAGPAGPAGATGAAGPPGAKGATGGGVMSTGNGYVPVGHPITKPGSTGFYIVKPGESLASIATKFGLSVTTLAHANVYTEGPKKGQQLGTGAGLPAGQRLTIPHVAAAK